MIVFIVEKPDKSVYINGIKMDYTFDEAVREAYAMMKRMGINERERSKDLRVEDVVAQPSVKSIERSNGYLP